MDKLRAMALLVAAAETGSFSSAGRRFGLSPASVSRQVSELEAQLGVTLIHRSTRNLALSEVGQAYVRQAEAILASVDAAEASVTATHATPRGLLRVHSRTMFGLSVLAPLMPEFDQRYPELVVELHISERPVRLREEGFDIDFRIAEPRELGLMRKRLFQSERLVVGSPDYIAGTPAIDTPRDLLRHRCLVYWLSADPVYWRFRKRGTVEELQVPVAFASNNGQILLDTARRGLGLALLDDYTVAGDLARGTLQRVLEDYRVTNTTFEEGIYATFLETVQMPAKLRVFLDFVSDNWPRALQPASGNGIAS